MNSIQGKREGRPGVWLIDAETAIELVQECGDEIHTFIGHGNGPFIGANRSKEKVVEFLKSPGDVKNVLLFDPNVTMKHQLVVVNGMRRLSFDIGEIDEARMEEAD